MATLKPDLTRVWASNANPLNVVDPDTTTPDKFINGWSQEIPTSEHFNFLQQTFTQGLAHMNEQGISVWDNNTLYPIGGLVKGSDGSVYIALSEQSDNNPVTDAGLYWFLFLKSDKTLKVNGVQLVPTSSVLSPESGLLAISDGSGGGFDGSSGEGLYRRNLANDTWVFIG